jgi:hypothetical protein
MFRAALNQLIYFPSTRCWQRPSDAVAARDWRRLRRLSKHRPKGNVYSDPARRSVGAIQQSPPRGDRQSLVDMAVAALPLKEARRISAPSVAMPMQMGVSARPRVSCAFGDREVWDEAFGRLGPSGGLSLPPHGSALSGSSGFSRPWTRPVRGARARR